ncbi:MAG: hypothetical protein LUO81_01695 [Methanoregulaceae archaeon]|nr:hypothetical protein [Methanoregulaceae archaeon]
MKTTSVSVLLAITLVLVFIVVPTTASTAFDAGKAAIISGYKSSSSSTYTNLLTDLTVKPLLKSDLISTYQNANKNTYSVLTEQYKISLSGFFFGGAGEAAGGGGGGMGVF